ncbi:hypothetical protein ACFROC_13235, partial [Nocardia tengchongensis]|uniref:hypothetical protein n=1 Tax=Nocardia tengchongensis TaxID=2055889 RepID=UPI00368C66E3
AEYRLVRHTQDQLTAAGGVPGSTPTSRRAPSDEPQKLWSQRLRDLIANSAGALNGLAFHRFRTITLNPITGATVGKSTTLTAKVTPAAAGGTVTFEDDAFAYE